MTSFPNAAVTVTLTGEEWTAILAKLALGDAGFSANGSHIYRLASDKLASQLGAASDGIASGARPQPRLVAER